MVHEFKFLDIFKILLNLIITINTSRLAFLVRFVIFIVSKESVPWDIPCADGRGIIML